MNKPELDAEHIDARKTFVDEMLEKAEDEIDLINFSDEKTFKCDLTGNFYLFNQLNFGCILTLNLKKIKNQVL